MVARNTLISIFALALVAGCGKAGPTAPAAPDGATTPSTRGAPDPGSQAAAPSPESGEAAGAKDPATALKATASPPPRTLAPSGPMDPISLSAFAPEVTVVVGTPSLELLVHGFSGLAGRAGRELPLPPDPLEAAREALRMQLRLTDADWIDGSRPLKLAVPDPKTWPDGFCALLPVRGGKDAVTRGLGPALIPAEGHAGRIEAGGRSVFLDYLGADALVVTSHAELFGRLRAFVEGPLTAWQPIQPLVLEASVENINRIYAKELQAIRGLAGALGKQLAGRAAVPAQASTIAGLVDGAFNFVAAMSRFGVAVDPVGDSARLAFGLRGVDGSELSGSIASLAGKQLGLGPLLSPDSWFGVLTNVPSALTELDRGALKAQLTAPGDNKITFSEAEATRVIELIDTLIALSEGDSAFALASEGAFPLALHSVSKVTDGAKARDAMIGLAEVAFDKLLDQARQQMSAEGAPAEALPANNLPEALALANKTGAPMGISLEVVTEQRDGDVVVEALVAHIDWAKSGLAKSDPETFAAVAAMVGPKLALALARSKGYIAFAVGPEAVDRASGLAAGKAHGGEPQLNAAAAGSFAAGSMRVGKLLQALSTFPSIAPRREAFAKLPADEAFVFEADSDGKTLVAVLHLPMKLIEGLMQID